MLCAAHLADTTVILCGFRGFVCLRVSHNQLYMHDFMSIFPGSLCQPDSLHGLAWIAFEVDPKTQLFIHKLDIARKQPVYSS